ncbi:MAG: TIGR03960 family B12-binding radical SAM protein, partial [Candidatus Desulfofervidaceae bacterium]|nr:TIGR03960 family B12-binding radical SAM protein [Candidatus Desulfofervidaceae bacterium]
MTWSLRQFYRRRLGKEKGAIYKDWGGKIRIALAYPNIYHVGMSNLGFQTVYALFNQHPNVVCERVFLPDPEEESLLLKYNSPLLSHESQQPVKNFDLLVFSISFENDYLNVLKIISLADLPLLSKDRQDNSPLIAAGGIATWLNPEPLASYLDFFLIGEGEAFIDEFIQAFLVHISEEKERLLRSLAQTVPGIYVPAGYEISYQPDGTLKTIKPKPGFPLPVEKRRLLDMGLSVAHSQIITSETEFSQMFLVEIERGCFHGCRFCGAGYLYRPPRMRPLSQLCKTIANGLKLTSKIGLIGAAVNDYPHLEPLLNFILQHEGSFSVSSLRADKLTSSLLTALKRSHHKTITIAPEAGSQRLRDTINKGLSEDQILKAASLVAEFGFATLKLYFILGLPTETQPDIEAIAQLVKKIKKVMLEVTQGRFCPHLHLSIASFVPKPFTPLQWHPMDTVQNLKQKMRWLKSAFKKEKGITVTFDLPKWAYTQALLSRGDRRVGKILYLALKKGWSEAFKTSLINPDFFVLRERKKDELFPWEIISHGLNKSFLYNEYKQALQAKPSPPCP